MTGTATRTKTMAMKGFYSTLICLFALLPIKAQNDVNSRIAECLNTSDWFELRRVYEHADKAALAPMLNAFAESMIATQFNQPERACASIRKLINNHGNEIGVGNISGMGFILAANEAKLGRYADAAKTLGKIIQALRQHTDSTTLAMLQQYEKQYQILSKYEGINSIVSSPADYHLPFRLDSIGQKQKHAVTITIPAVVNKKPQDIILDSGSGVNIVSTKAAERLGLDIYDTQTEVTGFGKQNGKFAIAPRINIGNLTLENVPFYVIDISSGIDSIDVYLKHLDMILGIDFIYAMKELQIDFEKREIVIPQKPITLQEGETPNLTGGISEMFFVEGRGNGERLVYVLDTGADASSLGKRYFLRNKEHITANCQADTLRSAGAGGILIEQAYRLPDFRLETNGTSYTFPEIMVETQGRTSDIREADFGMDYFLQFKKVVFNTQEMFVRVTK